MEDTPRLIEHAFPLKQASLDSVHEKNVRHGHISTLHIWPARRPLAACRAALIATLLPDPSAQPKPDGMSDEEWHKEIIRQRQELCEKIGGKVVKKIEKKRMPNGQVVEREKEVTEGGILHWGRETENKEILEWFRQEIRKTYGGRAPKVLDPFAGGGAIPLEAMRLGCEATAVDINPVAWFILKCTLEYPQKLAGKTWPLPGFIVQNESFMREFLEKAKGLSKGQITKALERMGRALKKGEQGALDLGAGEEVNTDADLAWHVRAWGQWVLDRARRELAKYYPTYADFEPLDLKSPRPYEKQPMRLVPPKEDGTPDVDALNAEFSEEYLANRHDPRWVAKPTVAYLWARTVKCNNCRGTIPLLKTPWLCKKDKKRVLLTMEPNPDKAGVVFGIENNVPVKGGNAAQRREHDRRIGIGTMSRSGAKCACCPTIMTMEDIRLEGRAGRLGTVNTGVVVNGQDGKRYRLPTEHEIEMAEKATSALPELFAQIPFGIPDEPLPSKEALGFRVPLYGFDKWSKLFTPRQLLALGTFTSWTRAAKAAIEEQGYENRWREALCAELAICLDKLADRQSALCRWDMGYTKVHSTFARFALPILWDFCQGNPLSETTGNYGSCVEWVAQVVAHASKASDQAPPAAAYLGSAIGLAEQAKNKFHAIVTDPPYYDAIPYSDLMDFFYVWLRRALRGVSSSLDEAFSADLSPKWNHEKSDGELIDDASRHEGNADRSKRIYEDGMFRAFQACSESLSPGGNLVIVFAHKQPDAWETLASAIIRAGFVVNGSWPIQTEMGNRMRALSGAALASSVWLVCKKRPADARPGWDNQVLEEMRKNIREKLREFWDAGIRGPDFVWAATGPALEAYSKHAVVKKANDPGQVLTVSEFLAHVRRMVVDFVVGRVLATEGPEDLDSVSSVDSVASLDSATAYYLLHRHDFGMDEAPAGACILYAISCGISDKELADTWDLIGFTKGNLATEDTESTEDEDSVSSVDSVADSEEDSGSKVKLKTWAQRKGSTLGYDAPSGRPVPLIDRVHCLMHLWKAGDLHRVDEYLDGNGLRRQELFKRLLQSLIELSPHGSEERSLLESLSNHLQARGAVAADQQLGLSV
jgi:putative DNA methylase